MGLRESSTGASRSSLPSPELGQASSSSSSTQPLRRRHADAAENMSLHRSAPTNASSDHPPITRFASTGSATSEEAAARTVVEATGASGGQPPPASVAQPRGLRRLRELGPSDTTLAVRNVPRDYDLEQLLRLWEPDGSYDLLHFPYSLKAKHRLGYCFINFTSHEAALEFQRTWHGRFVPGAAHFKSPLDVAAARDQGLLATLEQYRGKDIERMTDLSILPAVFDHGRLVDVRDVLVKHGIIAPMPGHSTVC